MLTLGQVTSMMEVAWAKFDPHSDEWLPLYAHLEDTAEVARHLFATWFSPSQRAMLSNVFGDERLAHGLAIWLGAAHDVGKATSAFAQQAPSCRARMEDVGYVFPVPDPAAEARRRYPHGSAGQLAVQGYLREKLPAGAKLYDAHAIAEIVGGHHGRFPSAQQLGEIPGMFTHGEDPAWSRVRGELLHRADAIAGLGDPEWQQILARRVPEAAQALLNGFLIVCDWIASNQYYFPYEHGAVSSERARTALRRLAFGEGWQPQEDVNTEEYYADRFGIERPRPVQHAVVELAKELDEPSFMLIEAPTGEGKTEMAFAAAEALASRFGLRGVVIALPTRATANAMFGRVLAWLRSGGSDDAPLSVSLAHAKSQFDEQFQSLFESEHNQPERTYDDEGMSHESRAAVVANQWFNGRKRSAFADFVVSTIDQLLFMTLKAKHLTLRHLGLSGKVVVLDEVHAADDFMSTYLRRALEWLGAYGVPVIALSATLPPAQRRELLHAYRSGAKRTGMVSEEIDSEILALADAVSYPLVTVVGAAQARQRSPERSGRRIEYRLEEVNDAQLVDSVLHEAEAGGCIAVVCNTVRRAQQTYQALKERYTGEIALLHSRFTVESRNRQEQELVRRLGPGAASRPERMIVVATQVIESSLDVDFDLMFTDIAPIDLLIQRLGRLHRHARAAEERPERMRTARAILTGGTGLLADPATTYEPPNFDPGAQSVYGAALLLRTAAALRRNRERAGADVIRVPGDVPELIRDTYAETVHLFPGWEQRQQSAERELAERIRDQQERSRQYVIDAPGYYRISEWSRLSYAEASDESSGAAQVRDADPSIEVVLVQQRGGVCYPVPWLPEQLASRQIDALGGIQDRELERVVATCTVSLPAWMTRGAALDLVLDDLESNGIEGWQRSIWLRGMLPLILDEELSATVNGHRVRYDQEIGLIIEGKESA